MTNHEFEGSWKQLKGSIKNKWGKLTDDEIDQAEGSWEKLVGTIQKKYGKKRDEVEREVSDLFDRATK